MMTREQAIKLLEYPIYKWSMDWDEREDGLDYTEAIEIALTALRPVSREQVEKVWRGEWVKCKHADYYVCNKCSTVSKTGEDEFCKSCGAPMTEDAVQMVMERLEALKDGA